MRTHIHANATTTPKTRALIQASDQPVAVLARQFGVSETTIRRWRRRTTTEDRSHTRHRLGQATTPLDEALIAELRTRAGLGLDDITEVMQRCVHPGLSRGSVWRALRRAGLSAPQRRGAVPAARFDETSFGYVHVDLKYLGKLQGRGEFAFVAIERTTRFVHLEVLPDRAGATAAAALQRFLEAFPGRVHTVLTDNGFEFTDRFRDGNRDGAAARPTGRHPFDAVCAGHGIRHRLTRPYRPQTNGMAERFNRRIAEALDALPPVRATSRTRTKFADHAQRTAFLLAFVHDYNRTRLRCLAYTAPLDVLNNQIEHNTMGTH
jgi:transposase InsO family protein